MAVGPPVDPGAGWGRTRPHMQVVQTHVGTGSCSFREAVAVFKEVVFFFFLV